MNKTIRTILSATLLWGCSYISAQTSAVVTQQNFTKLRTFTKGDGSSCRDETVYLDGLGREREHVNVGFTSGNDLVQVMEYDSTGVPCIDWLPTPCPTNGTGYYTPDEVSAARASVYSDSHPFGKTVHEHSPLMRPMAAFGAGSAWHNGGKSVRTAYLGNTGIGSLRCANYTATDTLLSITIMRKGNHLNGRLNVVQTTDEDGNISLDFADRTGRMLLHRRVSGDDYADTYYVYNDRGLLVAVLPPGASHDMDYDGTWTLDNSEELRQYAYLYAYDPNLRVSGRKLPGCEWQKFEYDRINQLVLTQTGNQKARNAKIFTINDKFGRKALAGIGVVDYDYWQIGNVYAYRSKSNDNLLGYSIKWINIKQPIATEAYYYDDYSMLSEFGLSALSFKSFMGYGTTYPNPKGKLTLSAEAVLKNDIIEGYIWTSYYYDDHDRLVQTSSILAGKSYDCTTYSYDFCGNILKTLHQHGSSPKNIETSETTRYVYDNQGRLLTEFHSINNSQTVVLHRNTYDDLGRLVSSSRGMSDTLTTTYRYDIRNHPIHTGCKLFYEDLYYNTSRNGSTPLFNGRISAVDAGVPPVNSGPVISLPPTTSCNYGYDGFGRLVSATRYKNGRRTNDYDSEYAYDMMGNILSIKRTGQTNFNKYGLVDDITFEYDGNRIVKATNVSVGPFYCGSMHYGDYADEPVEFAYDADGNLVCDADKGISLVRYDILNQLQQITFNDRSTVSYTYTGTGRKLGVDYCIMPNSIYMPDYQIFPNPDTIRVNRTYYGNHVYDDGKLSMVLFDGGYISFKGKGMIPTYHFYITDHLGSVRLVTDANGNVEEQDNYYPYGALDGSSLYYNNQPYKYCGKELDNMLSLNWLDHGARMYDPIVARWWRMDPMAEKYYDVSPYASCGDNPISNIDLNGMFYDDIYYNEKGEELYRVEKDGVDNNFVIKTTQSSSHMYRDSNPEEKGWTNPISKDEASSTELEISKGNLVGPHMKNVVQLGNTSEMKAMLNNIEDNGKGGLIAINNREYSGSFTLYGVRNIKKGPIGDPRKGNKLPSYGNSQFHSHPSGKIKENGNICSWQQPPSKQDINAVKDKTNEYVVGMGSKLIYKYNSKGVFAVIPMSIFINIYD